VGTSPEIGPATVSRPYTRIYCIVYTIYIVPISLHRDAVAHSPGGAKVNPVCVDRVRGRLVWTSVYIIEDRVRCGDVPGNRPGDCFDAIYSYILYYIVSPQVGIYIYIYKLIRPCLCGPGTRQASVDVGIFYWGQSTLWGRPRKSARRPFRCYILVYTIYIVSPQVGIPTCGHAFVRWR